MVHGLDKFKKHFADCKSQYVLIGDTACDIVLGELGAPFRVTKDLDMVLIIEKIDPSFGKIFWEFVENAGYENRENAIGHEQYYRFTHPNDLSFPKMIELFCRQPCNYDLRNDSFLTPVHIDEHQKPLCHNIK